MIYLDTSALLKLYFIEDESERVQQYVMQQSDPLPIWELQQFEMLNAFRLKVFWGDITAADADKLLVMFDRRLSNGQYFCPEINRSELMSTFRNLTKLTPDTGCRTMDILHVACALQLSPDLFISFDERQRNLAEIAGLQVH